jgi:hypothetical protein
MPLYFIAVVVVTIVTIRQENEVAVVVEKVLEAQATAS